MKPARYSQKLHSTATALALTAIATLTAPGTAVAQLTPSTPAAGPGPSNVRTYTVQLSPANATKSTAESKPASPIDYSNEPAVLEQSASLYRYNADGTGDRTLRMVIRIQNDAVVRQFGLLSFPYAAANETVQLTYVRVRKPNGTVIVTNTSATQDMPAEVTREAPLYSDQRQLQLPVQGLAVGDSLEYEAVVHMKKAEATGAFWGALNFEHKAVARDQQIELRFPKSLAVTVDSPKYKAVVTTEGEVRVYRWQLAQLKPTVAPPGGVAPKDDDTPAALLPDVAWTTFKDWAAVGAWYSELSGDRALPNAEVKAKADALLAEGGATNLTEQEKIDRLYRFVSMQIRYIGVDFGVGRYQPHTAAEVLPNGYGDCKDKHTLLAALLASEGIHAEPVLIGMGLNIDKAIPAPNSFNHVITAVEQADGKRLWLDSTEEVAPPGMLMSLLRDKDALLMPARGPAALVKTPAGLPFSAYDTYTVKANLGADGKLTAHIDATLRGDLELLMRAALFTGGPGQWPQTGQGLSQALGFGGTVTAFAPKAVDTPGKPLQLQYDYERDSFGDWPNHRIVSMIPEALFATGTYDKKPEQPIDLGALRVETAHSVITLPDGYTVDTLPEGIHARSSFATFDVTYKLDKQDLVTEQTMQVLATKVPEDKWQEYDAFAKDVQGHTGEFVQLKEGRGSTLLAPSTANTTGGSVASSKPTAKATETTDAGAQALLAQAAQALQSHDTKTAQADLELARAAAPTQPGLGLMSAAIDMSDGKDAEAEADLKQELALHPDELERALPMQLWVELKQKHNADAITTLEAMRKLHPDQIALTRQEAALLTEEKRHEEAISLLEGAALHDPSDKLTMLQLGRAQYAAGRSREAEVTLKTALDGTKDPEILNDAAYEIADHNGDLVLANKDARAALDLLDAKSAAIAPDGLDKVARADIGTQALLSATWDTFGWVAFLQNDTTDAESYLRAAWVSAQHPEVGYHLGRVLEKEGKPQQALDAYVLAGASGSAPFGKSDDMAARRAALEKQGLHAEAQDKDGTTRLADERMWQLPLLVKKQSEADFYVLADATSVEKVQFVTGDAVLRSQEATLAAALAKNRGPIVEPTGSKAKLFRRGILSCSPVIHSCQFVVFLPRDTNLLDAKTPVAAGGD